MTLFNQAQEMLSQGFDTARGAVSGIAMESLRFVREFARLCSEGAACGWHEANGGNLSYRLTSENVEAARRFFDKEAGEWMPLGVTVPQLSGEFFLVTGAGSYLWRVVDNPKGSCGIVEIDGTGTAYRCVWGFADGARPTSELPSHLLACATRMDATEGACRVLYHGHPASVLAMTAVVPLESASFTQALWATMPEGVVMFPEGVGVVPWMCPGGPEIADATAALMADHAAVVWANHGLFVAAPDFDAAFGLFSAVTKAADVYLLARAANSGSDEFPNTLTVDELRSVAQAYHLAINEGSLTKTPETEKH